MIDYRLITSRGNVSRSITLNGTTIEVDASSLPSTNVNHNMSIYAGIVSVVMQICWKRPQTKEHGSASLDYELDYGYRQYDD